MVVCFFLELFSCFKHFHGLLTGKKCVIPTLGVVQADDHLVRCMKTFLNAFC